MFDDALSLLGKKWVYQKADENQVEFLVQRLGLPYAVCRVLALRGVKAESAELFLDPKLQTLMPNPSCLNDMDKTAAECFHQLMRRRDRSVIRAADTGTHGYINDIKPLFEQRRELSQEQVCIEQGSFDYMTAAQFIVIITGIKMVKVAQISIGLTVYGIFAGQDCDPIQQTARQICGTVCKYGKGHDITSSLCCIYEMQ